MFDRATGEMLEVNKYGKTINWAKRHRREDWPADRAGDLLAHACHQRGDRNLAKRVRSKNWGPVSFNPNTGLIYANTLEFGMKYKPTTPEFRAGTTYWGADIKWVFPKDGTWAT